MKKLASILLTTAIILCSFVMPAWAKDRIVPQDAKIVVSENAPETDRYAAQKLKEYLGKITGEQYEIVTDAVPEGTYEFVIGDTNRYSGDMSGKIDGSYKIKSINNGLAILGAGERGTIYGVFGFLKNYCGCGWYTSKNIVVPENTSLTIADDIDFSYDSYFEYTDTDWVSPCDAEYSLANGLSGGVYRDLTAEQGGTVDYISGFCHTLSTQFCAADTYFDTHPEYFALRDGKRVRNQLCLTNEDVYTVVRDEVMALLVEKHDESASLQIISLTQHDNEDYCQCEACAAIDEENGSQAGTVITFVNRIADDVAAAGYDNVAIDTFAYRYTRHTPTKVVPRDNVIVRLCTIECCFTHALDDAACEENVSLMADLKAWGEICDRIYVWDYTTNYAYTIGIFPDFGVIQRNMQIFYENGVKGVYEEGNYYMSACNTEFGELRSYLLSRLMLNPYCDYDAEMNSFLAAYYGTGAESIRAFIDGITQASAAVHIGIYDGMANIKLTEEQIAAFDELWVKAKEGAEGEVLANIERSELCWRYWKANTNSSEFAGMKKYSNRKALYDDIIASGATMSREGDKNFEKMILPNIISNPSDWTSTNRSVIAKVNYYVAWALYAVIIFAALMLFVLAIKKKQWLYIVYLPLFAAAAELIMWNMRAFLAWKDIDEYVITLVIYSLLFALIMVGRAKAKGKLTAKRIILNGLAGAVLFPVLYLVPILIVNNAIYNGAANYLSLSVSLLIVSATAAGLVADTAKGIKKMK